MSLAIPDINQKITIDHTPAHALPLFLSGYLDGAPLLVLTATVEEAQQHLAAWELFAPNVRTAFFPDWETLPYEHFSPHRDLISERLSVLWQLKNHALDVVVMPVATAMQKVSPLSFIGGRTFFLRVGETADLSDLRSNLIASGYQAVSHVVAAGEFAVRGSLLDLFPAGAQTPYRIDFFGDEVDSIKIFDVDTQRTISPVSEIRLLPAHEFPTDENAQTLFRQRFREVIETQFSQAIPYQSVSEGMFGSGIEYYMPLFFEEECASVLDYLGEKGRVLLLTDVTQAAENFATDIRSRFQMAVSDLEYPPLPPDFLYWRANDFQAALKQKARWQITQNQIQDTLLPDLSVNRHQTMPLQLLQDFQAAYSGRILLCAQTAGRRETMLSFMKRYGLNPTPIDHFADFASGEDELCLIVSDLAQGFRLPEYAVIGENDLYPSTVKVRTRRKKTHTNQDMALRDLGEIKVGDPVVHENHGIGRYAGLVHMRLGEDDEEMMLLQYANDAQLYVPVSQLHLISRYAGVASENVTLHHLGSASWQKAKRKAAQKAYDTAAELLNLYAQRAAQTGHAFTLNESDYNAFADGFEYTETEDQNAAIVAVIQDLMKEQPMDRLVCGDVGFGKTEVALRAAFVAVFGGKQVAVLAPTTLLVEQHTQTFRERFADFPVRIASLSRFNAGKETRLAIEGIANGKVDIVIGTHKLIQPDIDFHNLGLVIIDEEHRFGVRQKEQLKRLRANVDVLTLTATPIPRTLSMALEGLRDFSLITTAPEKRLAVKTFVKTFSESSIREAILRELKRGGQVFFLHNEVDTIENMKERLENLMPEARIAIAHGQMNTQDLERVMRGFLQQQYNLLLCTTIIETGIDIPNANTIIINRADKLGIAQLHQLRGRVGRSHHQAYAYLLTPESLGRDAQKRLDAIAEADELGAGFMLAMRDLEIRGAGEILGEGQSGEMAQVGMSMFSEMLKQAVRDLKNGRTPDLDAPLGVNTEIKLHAPALLPESYCPDIHERLILYKRLAVAENEEAIDAIYEELIDRFGLPESDEDGNNPVRNLIESHRLRITAGQMGVISIDATSEYILMTWGKNQVIDPVKVICLIQNDKRYRLAGQDKLRVNVVTEKIDDRIRAIRSIFGQLS